LIHIGCQNKENKIILCDIFVEKNNLKESNAILLKLSLSVGFPLFLKNVQP